MKHHLKFSRNVLNLSRMRYSAVLDQKMKVSGLVTCKSKLNLTLACDVSGRNDNLQRHRSISRFTLTATVAVTVTEFHLPHLTFKAKFVCCSSSRHIVFSLSES